MGDKGNEWRSCLISIRDMTKDARASLRCCQGYCKNTIWFFVGNFHSVIAAISKIGGNFYVTFADPDLK